MLITGEGSCFEKPEKIRKITMINVSLDKKGKRIQIQNNNSQQSKFNIQVHYTSAIVCPENGIMLLTWIFLTVWGKINYHSKLVLQRSRKTQV